MIISSHGSFLLLNLKLKVLSPILLKTGPRKLPPFNLQLSMGQTPVKVGDTYKFDSLSQLSMWGAIYVESSGTGFPMEFIGDAHDSTLGGAANSNSTLGENFRSGQELPRPARGIN